MVTPVEVVAETPKLPPDEQRRQDTRQALAMYEATEWRAIPALRAIAETYVEVAPFLNLRIAPTTCDTGATWDTSARRSALK